ncbi:MAG: ATP-dependent sacrificial sulfur transferase LarE [Verrucomicrobiales bacterium]
MLTSQENKEETASRALEANQQLLAYLRSLESAAVAFSGGVDSAVVLKAGSLALGGRCVAAIAISPSLPATEREGAVDLARGFGVRVAEIETRETEDPRYQANPPDRCYFCKDYVYGAIVDFARREGFGAVVDGMNADDRGDIRPGRRAAREKGVLSPLAELGIGKVMVRAMARAWDLPVWNKPAAACLSSRVPYGDPVTPEVLGQIERAEASVRALGFEGFRVRHHGAVARIEFPAADMELAFARRAEISERLRASGYTFVSLDLDGFRSGSLNENLRPK